MDPQPALSSPVLADAVAFDGPDRALELLDLFAGVLEEALAAIEHAQREAGTGALREPAHRLKGSAAMFGDAALSAAAARVEVASTAGDQVTARAAATDLVRVAGETRSRLAADRALISAPSGPAR